MPRDGGQSRTRAGTLLKHHIPIRAHRWVKGAVLCAVTNGLPERKRVPLRLRGKQTFRGAELIVLNRPCIGAPAIR